MSNLRKTIQSVLLDTSPVMTGYLVVGFAFGLLMQTSGYSVIWAIAMGLVIYSGSMQFVCINFLIGTFSWLQIVVISLAMNVRHMLYGLSFIDIFHRMGRKRLYMIYSLTDETYSLLCSKKEQQVENQMSYFMIAIFHQCYWLMGSILGNLIGNIITINTKGIEFAMTALFIVSLLDQLQHEHNCKPALIGLMSSFSSLILFGKDNLVLPALLAIIIILLSKQEREGV